MAPAMMPVPCAVVLKFDQPETGTAKEQMAAELIPAGLVG
jgi:hypothetical protein